MVEVFRFSALHCLEVINLCDGTRMGAVCDLIFCPKTGQINALVVPANTGPLGFFSKDEIILPWHCIETLGSDYILVRYAAPP